MEGSIGFSTKKPWPCPDRSFWDFISSFFFFIIVKKKYNYRDFIRCNRHFVVWNFLFLWNLLHELRTCGTRLNIPMRLKQLFFVVSIARKMFLSPKLNEYYCYDIKNVHCVFLRLLIYTWLPDSKQFTQLILMLKIILTGASILWIDFQNHLILFHDTLRKTCLLNLPLLQLQVD